MEDFKHIPGYLPYGFALSYLYTLTQPESGIVWYDTLLSTEGTPVPIKRKMAYASDEPTTYHYANLSFPGQAWVNDLLSLRNLLHRDYEYRFNSVLLNLYEDGKDVIKWHSDKETSLGEKPVIAVLNLGATRTFQLRNIETKEVHSFQLKNGDLFLMLEDCQRKYVHQIPKEPLVLGPRISLTYRFNYPEDDTVG